MLREAEKFPGRPVVMNLVLSLTAGSVGLIPIWELRSLMLYSMVLKKKKRVAEYSKFSIRAEAVNILLQDI